MKTSIKRLVQVLAIAGAVAALSGCHVIGAHGSLYLGHQGHYHPAPARHNHYDSHRGDYHHDRRYRRSRTHTYERHYRRY